MDDVMANRQPSPSCDRARRFGWTGPCFTLPTKVVESVRTALQGRLAPMRQPGAGVSGDDSVPRRTEPVQRGTGGGTSGGDPVTERVTELLGRISTAYDPRTDDVAKAIVNATTEVRTEKERIYTLIESQLYPDREGRRK